jgi:uncharacterized membrane protein YqgA involved in biofilm formation
MYEAIPLATGAIVGILVYQRADSRLKWALIGVLSLVIGFVAASVSGEIDESILFVLFDAAQFVLASAAVMYLVARYRPVSRG